jgi:hypothetical protein
MDPGIIVIDAEDTSGLPAASIAPQLPLFSTVDLIRTVHYRNYTMHTSPYTMDRAHCTLHIAVLPIWVQSGEAISRY